MERAAACKAAGNAAFAAGDYTAAVREYTAGLDAVATCAAGAGGGGTDATGPSDERALRATLLSNRAMCQLKLRDFRAAVADASAALATGHEAVQEKALYRRAMVRTCVLAHPCRAAGSCPSVSLVCRLAKSAGGSSPLGTGLVASLLWLAWVGWGAGVTRARPTRSCTSTRTPLRTSTL